MNRIGAILAASLLATASAGCAQSATPGKAASPAPSALTTPETAASATPALVSADSVGLKIVSVGGPEGATRSGILCPLWIDRHNEIVLAFGGLQLSDAQVARLKQQAAAYWPNAGPYGSSALLPDGLRSVPGVVTSGPMPWPPPPSPFGGANYVYGPGCALEFQITKEYLGEDTHLVFLGSLMSEVLTADTWAHGKGSTVASVIDGSLHGYKRTGIAGVANTGTDRNWTGSHFNQANWYAFGRLAWDPGLPPAAIAEEWTRRTFSNDPKVVAPVVHMMLVSREAVVNYMTPLGIFPNTYQPRLAELYRRSTPIDFGYGYRWRRNESNLLLAVRADAVTGAAEPAKP